MWEMLLRVGLVLMGLVGWQGVGAQVPDPPQGAARSYVLVDITAGQVLAEHQPDVAFETASLTKLMTAYVVFDALRAQRIKLKQTFPVSTRAWKMSGSRMFIDPTMQVPVEDLIKGMLVQAGNDATIALAEGVAGSAERFVEWMNQQATALGMTATVYKNPEGLSEPGHTTTARDLAILAQRLVTDFPDRLAYFSLKKYRFPGTPEANDTKRNLLLFRDPSVDGLHTGYSAASGYSMVATAQRELGIVKSRRLLAVLLGVSNEQARAQESQKLLNWGYTAFDAVQLFEAQQPILQVPVWKGRSSELRLGRLEPLVVAVPSGQAARLRSEVTRPDPLVAPYAKGQAVGRIKIYIGERLLTEKPLLALDSVSESGVIGRAWDAMRLWIK